MLNGHSRNNYAQLSRSLKRQRIGHICDDLYDKVAADLTLAHKGRSRMILRSLVLAAVAAFAAVVIG